MGRWITKNGAHIYLEKSLSQRIAEHYAINSYISSDSFLINECLREGYELNDRQKEIVKNLDSALEDEEDYEGIVTRSLMFHSKNEVKHFLNQHEVGKNVTYLEYLSCTASEKYYNSNGQVQLHVYSRKGKNMIKYNPEEAEVLYKRNSSFKVYKVSEINGVHHIFMEEY